MARRLLAFGLVLILVGAPLVAEICRVFCAEPAAVAQHHHSTATEGEPSQHHHRAAEPSPLSTRALVHSVAHACAELVSVVVESRETVRAPLTMAIVTVPVVAVVVVPAAATADVDSRHGPPGLARSLTPLRI